MLIESNPEVLAAIGMTVAQQSCLFRCLNRPQFPQAPDDAEAAALAALVSLCATAGVVPSTDYEEIARRLMEQGVADGISLRDSLACSPPALDLKSVVVKRGQAYTIMDFVDSLQ